MISFDPRWDGHVSMSVKFIDGARNPTIKELT
jgi:hypothetical protein